MKRLIWLLAIASILALTLVACAQAEPAPVEEPAAEEPAAEEPAPAEEAGCPASTVVDMMGLGRCGLTPG